MTIILKDDNGKKLPQNVQKRVNTFIDHLPNVSWFKPNNNLKKEEVEKQAQFTLECFGLKASIEYRSIKTEKDWNSALNSALSSEWNSALNSAVNSAWNSALNSAVSSALNSARDSAVNSAVNSVLNSARNSVLNSAVNSALNSARDSAVNSVLNSARNSVLNSARASVEILLDDNEEFKKKYPNGACKQFFKLWEMGLYPVGVLEETKTFVIYVPPCSVEFPDEFNF